MKIQIIPIEKLIPYANNPRVNQSAVDKVAASIKEFGFKQPVVVDAQMVVIAGHTRLLAAQKLGLKAVPTLVANDLSGTQIKAYRLADNRTAEDADWDEKLLAQELAELDALSFNLELTGFEEEELENFLKSKLIDESLEEDEIPEPPKIPITKLGDVWLLGQHRLICGDAGDISVLGKLMGEEKASICFTSPPYNVGENMLGKKYAEFEDDKTSEGYLDFLKNFTTTALTYCKMLIVNIQQISGNKIAFIEYLYHFRKNLIDTAIWNKGSQPAMQRKVMNSGFEYLLFFTLKDKPSRSIPTANFRGTVDNVYLAPRQYNNEFSQIHNATFPLHLPAWIIKSFDSTKEKIILDVFGGTGTTLIVCEKLNRKCRIVELMPVYCDVIITRWEKLTGEKAILEKKE